ncbi:hypothetical protein SLE2022_395960 [Rubroshorea leprosula]
MEEEEEEEEESLEVGTATVLVNRNGRSLGERGGDSGFPSLQVAEFMEEAAVAIRKVRKGKKEGLAERGIF